MISTKKTLKGGILLYAVFTSFVIAIFCSSIILLMYYLNQSVEHFVTTEYLKDEAEAALNYALVNSGEFSNGEEKSIFIFNKSFNTTIKKKSWGTFALLFCKAKSKKDSICKIALVGTRVKNEDKVAIHLSDPTQNLSVSGNVELIGTCYLPKLMIKKVNIEGRNIEKELISDNIFESNNASFPQLDDTIFKPIKEYFYQNLNNFTSINLFLRKDTIFNSFHNSTLFLYTSESLLLSNKIINGNIVLISGNDITIDNNCILNNIIIVAKKIKLLSAIQSNLQAYAKEEIIVGDNVNLYYPSSLVIYNDKNLSNETGIYISGKSKVSGSLILCDQNNKKSKIHINHGSVIEGIVYSTNAVEHKGTIYGSLYCSKLSYTTKSGQYENLLMDATINAAKQSKYFIAPYYILFNKHNGIVKWLN